MRSRVERSGGADVAPFGEVALELGAYLLEASSDQAVHMSCPCHGSLRSAPDHGRRKSAIASAMTQSR